MLTLLTADESLHMVKLDAQDLDINKILNSIICFRGNHFEKFKVIFAFAGKCRCDVSLSHLQNFILKLNGRKITL